MPKIFKRTTDAQLHLVLIQAISEQDEYKANGLIDPHNPLSISLTYLDGECGSILNHALTTKFYRFIPALWERIKSKGEEVIKINLSSQNNLTQSCYHLIVESGNPSILEEFLQYADKKDIFLVDNEGNTPLHAAAKQQSLEMTQLLLKYATDRIAELNKVNIFGDTPLLIVSKALSGINPYLFSYLIQQGADMRLHDKQGKNIFYYLTEQSCQKTIFIALQESQLSAEDKCTAQRAYNRLAYTRTENGIVDIFLYHYRQYVLQNLNEVLISDYLSLVERHNIAAYVLSFIELRPTSKMKIIRDKILMVSSNGRALINLMALSSLSEREATIHVPTSLYGKLTINARILMIMSNMHANLVTTTQENKPAINLKVLEDLNRADAANFQAIGIAPRSSSKDDDHILDLGRALYQINMPYQPAIAQYLVSDLAKLDALIFDIDSFSSSIQRQIDVINKFKNNKLAISLSIALAVFVFLAYFSIQRSKELARELAEDYGRCSKNSICEAGFDHVSMTMFLFGSAMVAFSLGLLVATRDCNMSVKRRSWRTLIDDRLQKEVVLPLQEMAHLQTHHNRYGLPARYLSTTHGNLQSLETHIEKLAAKYFDYEELIILLRSLNNDLKILFQEIEKSGLSFSLHSEQASKAASSYSW